MREALVKVYTVWFCSQEKEATMRITSRGTILKHREGICLPKAISEMKWVNKEKCL